MNDSDGRPQNGLSFFLPVQGILCGSAQLHGDNVDENDSLSVEKPVKEDRLQSVGWFVHRFYGLFWEWQREEGEYRDVGCC